MDRLLERDDDLHAVNLHLVQVCYLVSAMGDTVVWLDLDEFFEIFVIEFFLWVLVIFEKFLSKRLDFFRLGVLELDVQT